MLGSSTSHSSSQCHNLVSISTEYDRMIKIPILAGDNQFRINSSVLRKRRHSYDCLQLETLHNFEENVINLVQSNTNHSSINEGIPSTSAKISNWICFESIKQRLLETYTGNCVYNLYLNNKTKPSSTSNDLTFCNLHQKNKKAGRRRNICLRAIHVFRAIKYL